MKLRTHWQWLCAIAFVVSAHLVQSQADPAMNIPATVSANCDTPPIIFCPNDFSACPSAGTDPSNTGYAIGLPGKPICSTPLISYTDNILSSGPCTGEVTILRTWTATDPQDTSLNVSCEQLITLSDTMAPLILDCPTDTTVAPNAGCFANVFWDQPLVVDNCGELNLQVSHVSGDQFPIGETVVTYLASDACGNETMCSFTIKVEGECCDLPPIINCPPDYSGCPGDTILPKKIGRARAMPGRSTCEPPAVFYQDDTLSQGPCAGAILIERIWFAVDPYDPSLNAMCVQTIELKDDQAPFLFGCPQDITVDTDPNCIAVVTWVEPSARDNCSSVTIEQSHSPGDTFQIGTTDVMYIARDECGNADTCSFTVTVNKKCCTSEPILMCPMDFKGCPGGGISPMTTGEAMAEPGDPDCQDPILTFFDTFVDVRPCYLEISRLWVATDPVDTSLSVSCVQRIILTDDEAPKVVDCARDTTVLTNDDCVAVVNWDLPIFSDNCGMITLTSTHEPGDTFQIGTTTVTYTATDACGNQNTCSFEITVVDNCCNKPPSIVCPPDYQACPKATINPDTTGRPMVTKAHASCGDPVVTYSDTTISAGPCPGEEVIQRTWIATDPDDPKLADTCIQTIVLTDDEAPIFWECPADTTVSPNDDCIAIVNWTPPVADDNCGLVSVTASHQPGDTFQIGTTTVTYTAVDACGNDTTCTFDITVTDECCQLPPTIDCPADFSGCPGFDISPDFVGRPVVQKSSDFCDDPVVTFVDDTISTGPCPGGVVIERTWTAVIPNRPSLMASCVQSITLADIEPPVLTNCPADTIVSPNPDCQAIVFWTRPGISDNCGIGSITSTHEPGDTFDLGTTTVTYTLVDACGLSTTCSFTVTVLDDCCNKPPTIDCPADFTGCPGAAIDPSKTGEPTITKGHPTCEDPIVSFEDVVITSGPCMGAVEIERIWTATDPVDTTLSVSCTQKITLEDTEAPVLTNCPQDVTLSPNVDCEAKVSWQDPDVNDNCGKVTLTSNFSSGDLFPIGTTTVVITATDDCGNQTTCSFDITVLDDCCNKPPVIDCPATYTDCPGSSIDPSIAGMPVVTKGHPTCEDPIVTFEDVVISMGPCTGAIVIERIWTATDPSDTTLTASCVQDIVLEDTEAPVWSGCPGEQQAMADMTCKAEVSWTPPVATDNCTGLIVTSSHEPGDSFDIGTTVVTYTATDACGQVTLCQFDVIVDGDVLFIECPDDTVITSPAFSFGDYVYWTPPSVVQCDPTCPDSIPGFIYMGERNGHRYFCSLYRASWTDAQEDCDSLGGYLAVINDEDENDYIAGLLMNQPAYIGLNDFASEGDFEWVNGDPLTFTSWATGEPDNKNNYQDAVELHPDGTWKDQFYYVHNEFVLEIPCYDVYQIEGPENGGFFTCGETEVAYVVEDFKGRSDTCSFTVEVDCSGFEPYCHAKGLNSDQYWLNSLKVGDFFKRTGNDRGIWRLQSNLYWSNLRGVDRDLHWIWIWRKGSKLILGRMDRLQQ